MTVYIKASQGLRERESGHCECTGPPARTHGATMHMNVSEVHIFNTCIGLHKLGGGFYFSRRY